MSRIKRPYIPIPIRVQVAERQLLGRNHWLDIDARIADLATYGRGINMRSLSKRLDCYLEALFQNPQLDHDPALILRKFNKRTGKYTPDANDPAYLVYREKADHQRKTTGRKPGAQRTITTKGSDVGLKAKFARLEGRTKKRPKREIPVRKNPWPKRRFVK